MGTSFLDIYNLAEKIHEDQRICNKPTNQIYSLYNDYLTFARAGFQWDCKNDLDDIIPFAQQDYIYSFDGNDYIFPLSPTPPVGCQFYVGYYDPNDKLVEVPISNYSFDNVSNILTILNETFAKGTEVYIGAYVVGSFNSELTNPEKIILAEGMLVPWSQEMLMRDKQLHQIIYGGSSKIYSQAQHITALSSLVDNQHWVKFKGLISEYTYRNAINLNGLGGGLI